jgi:hypothetical protein
VKLQEDIIGEIYDHTHKKVNEITSKTIEAYNNIKDYKQDLVLNPKLHDVMNENIAFPVGYRKPETYIEKVRNENLAEKNLKVMADTERFRLNSKPMKGLTRVDLASVMQDPEELA